MNPSYRIAPPRAGAMIKALRGLGYTTASSIAANATSVWISFHWAGIKSSMSILDNGNGMTPSELDLAMRLGEKILLTQEVLVILDGSD